LPGNCSSEEPSSFIFYSPDPLASHKIEYKLYVFRVSVIRI